MGQFPSNVILTPNSPVTCSIRKMANQKYDFIYDVTRKSASARPVPLATRQQPHMCVYVCVGPERAPENNFERFWPKLHPHQEVRMFSLFEQGHIKKVPKQMLELRRSGVQRRWTQTRRVFLRHGSSSHPRLWMGMQSGFFGHCGNAPSSALLMPGTARQPSHGVQQNPRRVPQQIPLRWVSGVITGQRV